LEASNPAAGSLKQLAELSARDCYRLLATVTVGRLGLLVDNYPLVIPVNYALDRDVVCVRTRAGSVVAGADHANVSFEVDELHSADRTAWSVLVRGQAEVVTPRHDADLAERTRASGAQPWAPGEKDTWLRIIPHGISGRRIERDEDDGWRLGTAAYM
jgi:uncharacterized protein